MQGQGEEGAVFLEGNTCSALAATEFCRPSLQSAREQKAALQPSDHARSLGIVLQCTLLQNRSKSGRFLSRTGTLLPRPFLRWDAVMRSPRSRFTRRCSLSSSGSMPYISYLTICLLYVAKNDVRSEEHTSELQSRPHLV